jgi:arylformamidase
MHNPNLIDISVPLRPGMPVWPGDPPFEIETLFSDPAMVSRISLCVHAGTHVDAPLHRRSGAAGADALPLDILCGPCRVVTPRPRDVQGLRIVSLPELLAGTTRLLIRSGFDHGSDRAGQPYHGLAPDLARALVGRGIRLVGIDSPTVETLADIESGSFAVHDALLDAGVVIVENLDLAAVADGEYELLCLPLKIPGADGAPARAVLRRR